MNKVEIITIDGQQNDIVEKIKSLFDVMYDEFIEMGALLQPAEGASDIWYRSIENSLNRFSKLVAVVNNDTVVGFAHGSLLMAPPYLKAGKTGVITHVYVEKIYRKEGLAKSMVRELEDWFKKKNVHSVELQVISGNTQGKAFWERLNYKQELIQYRKRF